jgi:D-erythrulose 1-phosphate 3-epimerase
VSASGRAAGRAVLGFNCNCFTNRYDEPEQWTRLCREMGVRAVMFNVDLVDPWWPWPVQRRLCDRTLEACAKNGVRIVASFGGHHGHQHYLGHFDPGARRAAEDFFRRAIRQSAYLGAKSFGTCFAILTQSTHADPDARRRALDEAIAAYHRLARYAAAAGLPALAYEATSVPRETCATFAENDHVLEACSDMAVPLRVCLDMGHRWKGGTAEEADHLAWIRRYGSRCDVVDCQQTDLDGSRHWPFTAENNAKGIIRPAEVLRAVQESADGEVLLSFELRTAAYHPQEDGFLRDLGESVAYWRQWVKE